MRSRLFVTNLVCREKLGKAFKKHKSRRYWVAKSQAYKQSGLSFKKFCRSQGVPTSSFHRWFRRLEAEGVFEGDFIPVEVEESPMAFVAETLPVAVARDDQLCKEDVFEAPCDFKLTFNRGVVLTVPTGFDPFTLRQIVEVLSPC
jgi:ribosomal protein L33